jgi:hypothetical protein
MAQTTVRIAETAGTDVCVASEDGQKVYDAIAEAIASGDQVQLSFEGVEDLTSAFLNAAIGQLYGEFDEELLKERLLPPVGASDEDLILLKRVVQRAKQYFSDPKVFEEAEVEVLSDEH